jgi:HSP20 family protein
LTSISKNNKENKTMAFLEKWRPSKELNRFRGELDELMERFGLDRDWFERFPFDRELFGHGETLAKRLAVETCVEDGKFIVRTDVPGIDPKNIDIKVVGDVLMIKGHREDTRETRKADFFRRELRYGAFERSLSLPEGIKVEDLKADYHDGVLELSAPMPKEAAPKAVKIQVQGSKAAEK